MFCWCVLWGALCICAGQRGVLSVMQVFIKVSSCVCCVQGGYLDYSQLGNLSRSKEIVSKTYIRILVGIV